MKYNVKIGMEIHVELGTKSKMFCGCSAEHFQVEPNTHTCPVCLGLPGAMPVPNKKAIDWCLMIGLALGCKIRNRATFDRKHYFYPDLAKGFQISQYDDPFCYNGEMDGVDVTRVHMEEDTGKLLHRGDSLVDFNRSGVPLVEIVTEPDMKSSQEAVSFVRELQRVVRYLGVSDGDMEKGSMRLEANISVNRSGEEKGYKVEVKNLNSFKFLEQAIEYEIERQTEVLDSGEDPVQETRGFSDGQTHSQRSKEEAADYRYFPEPDIPPIVIPKEKVQKLRSELVELPWEKRERFKEDISLDDAVELARERERALYFERAVEEGGVSPQDIANVIINERMDWREMSPEELVSKILKKEESKIKSEDKLEEIIDSVIEENEAIVEEYRGGKEGAIQALVGVVMAQTKGKADGEITIKLLKEKLDE